MLTYNKYLPFNVKPVNFHKIRDLSSISLSHGASFKASSKYKKIKRIIGTASFNANFIKNPLQKIKYNKKASLIVTSSATSESQENNTNSHNASEDYPIFEPLTEVAKIPFKKLLCANRGEIAIRVFRGADELDIKSVAIYSEEDRLMPHRFKSDESYCVGKPGSRPVDCYLDIEEIISVAKDANVDVIHPGYGFLSENAKFAKRCQEEGITFVGPSPEILEKLGDKIAARKAAAECGVRIIPGTDEPVKSVEEAKAFAKTTEFPLMIKAAMGGGGRGLRVVNNMYELEDSFLRASSEAKAAFGDGRMFIEKYIEDPRHIEIQILADHYGNVVHLYERDCSVQRRHQKVVEIAPSIGLPLKTRKSLYRDAIKLAKHVNYKNAGTVEFMVDKNNNYYFLEVNPRIQVEHTVTEAITGVDIVQKQIYIAGGAKLSEIGLENQSDVSPPQGFAIQCRITSEDTAKSFQPDAGRLEVFVVPGGPGIRLDGSVTTGNVIGRYYDSLLCKVISSAPTFEKAAQKMRRALHEFQIRGIKTNILFLLKLLKHPEFMSGYVTTSFLGKYMDELTDPIYEDEEFNIKSSSTKILMYLAEMIVNGPNHPGANGPAPSKLVPSPVNIPSELKDKPLTGWKDILRERGPDGWAKAVRENKSVLLTDTTWRDAHQSLLATRVRTHDIEKVAPATAAMLAPLGSLEMWGGATFDVALRFLHECPWRRLEKLRELVPNIPFQMLLRGANAVGYTSYPDNVVKAFVQVASKTGMDIFRIFDSLNYIDNLKFGIDEVRNTDISIAEGTICYTSDLLNPKEKVYTLDYYLKLAQELIDHGVHSLAVKDMAGLLKPRAAEKLVQALRHEFPNTPLHIHTHDSAGTGVATQLASALAGADIVDCCLDSMSGMTSQPSMGAIVNALYDSDLDTGINHEYILKLDEYWEQTRGLYAPYESNLKSTCSDVYEHEMPGGQYTNLKFQAMSLGLGDSWDKIKKSYAMANKALGNIVKVTPSSKVVGDLAQFMVQNELDEHTVVEKAESLSFPNSVVEFLQGYLGQPPNGFPEPLRERVLKGKAKIEGRPGHNLAPMNLQSLHVSLCNKWGRDQIDQRDVLSSALYPKVFNEFKEWEMKFGNHIEKLPTRAFLVPLEEDEELEVQLAKGVTETIEYKAMGELQANGYREVFFLANGLPRVVQVRDTKSDKKKSVERARADPDLLGSVGAPMAGDIVEINVKPGTKVKAGDQLVVLSAMKMETAISAPCSGVVQHLAVVKGDAINAGDLVVQINTSDGVSVKKEEEPQKADAVSAN